MGDFFASSQRIHTGIGQAGRKALFITSLPFYWLLVFKFVLGAFTMEVFAFSVLASWAFSLFDGGWGILHNLAW